MLWKGHYVQEKYVWIDSTIYETNQLINENGKWGKSAYAVCNEIVNEFSILFSVEMNMVVCMVLSTSEIFNIDIFPNENDPIESNSIQFN